MQSTVAVVSNDFMVEKQCRDRHRKIQPASIWHVRIQAGITCNEIKEKLRKEKTQNNFNIKFFHRELMGGLLATFAALSRYGYALYIWWVRLPVQQT